MTFLPAQGGADRYRKCSNELHDSFFARGGKFVFSPAGAGDDFAGFLERAGSKCPHGEAAFDNVKFGWLIGTCS